MNELRKDYLLNRFVIVAPGRANRPNLFSEKPAASIREKHDSKCPFCPGNESQLIGITDETQKDNAWTIRVVPNKFTAVTLEGNPEVRTDNKFYTFAAAYGVHEVIIETPDHAAELEDLPVEHIQTVIQTYIKRIRALNDLNHIRYVSVFKNRGVEGGASLPHSHSQIIAYNLKPAWISEELMAHYDYLIKNESCPQCEIICKEMESYRRVEENASFAAFTPYASRFPYELRIYPKKHYANIVDLSWDESMHLAMILKKMLQQLDKLGYPPYNMTIHNAEPTGENFHFYVEILPRLSLWAGLELETGTIINKVSPEDAARFYRGE